MTDRTSSTVKNSNGNGWKNPRFLLGLGLIILGSATAFAVLRVTVANDSARSDKADEVLKELIDQKVDKVEYRECIKRIEQSVDNIQTTQERVESKVDKLLLRNRVGYPDE